MEDNITENNAKNPEAEKPEGDKVIKTFGLSNIAIKNRTTVIILTFLITIMGALAYVSMPKESFPEIVMAEIYVGTTYPGNSPVDMENLITRRIEMHFLTGEVSDEFRYRHGIRGERMRIDNLDPNIPEEDKPEPDGILPFDFK